MRAQHLFMVLIATILLFLSGSTAQAQGARAPIIQVVGSSQWQHVPWCPFDYWNGKPLRAPLTDDLCVLLFMHPCLFEGGPKGTCDPHGYRPVPPEDLVAGRRFQFPAVDVSTVGIRPEEPKVRRKSEETRVGLPGRPVAPPAAAPPRTPEVGKAPGPPRENPRPPIEHPQVRPPREGAPRGMDAPRMAPPNTPVRPNRGN